MGGWLSIKSQEHWIGDFEVLVEELLKPNPNEVQVKELMEKLSLQYDHDPVRRIGKVLEKMDQLVFETKRKKISHDLR